MNTTEAITEGLSTRQARVDPDDEDWAALTNALHVRDLTLRGYEALSTDDQSRIVEYLWVCAIETFLRPGVIMVGRARRTDGSERIACRVHTYDGKETAAVAHGPAEAGDDPVVAALSALRFPLVEPSLSLDGFAFELRWIDQGGELSIGCANPRRPDLRAVYDAACEVAGRVATERGSELLRKYFKFARGA